MSLEIIDIKSLDAIIDRKLAQAEYLSPEQVHSRFGLSRDFLDTLEKEGKIRARTIDGHPRIVRYRIDEIEKVFVER